MAETVPEGEQMENRPHQNEIPYHEYRAIAQLLRAHIDEHEARFRAMVAFGELVVTGQATDIDLIEIVEGWQGPRFWEFSGTAELPLRGRLRLYFLTPPEFEDPAVIRELEEQRWVRELLQGVRIGYEVIMESPPGYARSVLDSDGSFPWTSPPPSGVGRAPNPLRLHGHE